MNQHDISQLIKNRRSIFPPSYIDKEIPLEVIKTILENANWAPTHKFTEPWRFKVFRGEALKRMSEFQASYYKSNTPSEQFKLKKYEKKKANPLRSSCVIAICLQRDPEKRVPEWEELAAVACAVQNMWLTCTALDIGCYWSTPGSIQELDKIATLKEGESCIGFFYMGYHNVEPIEGRRAAVENKIEWIDR